MHFEFAWLKEISPLWDCCVKIGMSVLCGSIVGIERQIRRKAAGMRTNVMICLGSTLYVLATELIAAKLGATGMDPSRTAGQVVVGMGFIGAGAIIQSRGRVQGLTSAATMWVVAAIGVLIGVGFPVLALIVTLLVVVLLEGVGRFEHVVLGKCRIIASRISFKDDPATWEQLRSVFSSYEKKIEDHLITRQQIHGAQDICFMAIDYCHIHPDHTEFLLDLLKIPDVRQTDFSPTRGVITPQ